MHLGETFSFISTLKIRRKIYENRNFRVYLYGSLSHNCSKVDYESTVHFYGTACRLTHNSLLPFTLMDEGADGLRSGIAQDCIQHRFAILANNILALVAIRSRQDVANLFQQFDHSVLQTRSRK